MSCVTNQERNGIFWFSKSKSIFIEDSSRTKFSLLIWASYSNNKFPNYSAHCEFKAFNNIVQLVNFFHLGRHELQFSG